MCRNNFPSQGHQGVEGCCHDPSQGPQTQQSDRTYDHLGSRRLWADPSKNITTSSSRSPETDACTRLCRAYGDLRGRPHQTRGHRRDTPKSTPVATPFQCLNPTPVKTQTINQNVGTTSFPGHKSFHGKHKSSKGNFIPWGINLERGRSLAASNMQLHPRGINLERGRSASKIPPT